MTRLTDLETPCLLLDRARLEHNATTMINRCNDLGVTLRPHVKTPKSIEIARITQGGKTGPITVSTLREAEHFAQHGFHDILYSVGIVPSKLDHLTAIQQQTGATVRVVLDSLFVAEGIAAYDPGSETSIEVMIEIDCGEHRSGIAPDDPVLLTIARKLQTAPGITLVGVITHAGHSYGESDIAAVRALAAHERDSCLAAAERLRRNGYDCPVVSVGSTPTILHADHLDGVTEARCGVYALWDLAQASRGMCSLDDIAATVLTTVIGHNRQGNCIIIDAGALALSKDIGANKFMPEAGYGILCDAASAVPLTPLSVNQVHQEHGTIDIADATWFDRLPIGSLLRIMPNHTCMTCAAHDAYHVISGDQVVDHWGRINGW